jgi:hypothetical protein
MKTKAENHLLAEYSEWVSLPPQLPERVKEGNNALAN